MSLKFYYRLFCVLLLLALVGCNSNQATQWEAAVEPDALESANLALFDWFEYSGHDDIFDAPIGADEYRNPILTGYYPDPSVTVVGDDYYMVNSTFGFYPGIPVFHSQDLVNWTQLGNAVDRPDMMSFDGKKLGNHGVYAATIEYHEGVFYILNTCVACGGNFVLTSTDAAGPWSDPIWLPHVPGIDPSLFIDDDGKFYIVHHATPPQSESQYQGHTLINVLEVDPVTFEARSEDITLVDGADETPWNTVWIEGPHIYKVGGRYILSAPGGGTGYYHQQLAFGADSVFGPYTPYAGNPIITQHGLSDDRPDPVTATGHADIFQDASGDWWAVFLATRPYNLATPPQDPGRFHTGRETFLLPVTWKDGWPIILEKGEAVPFVARRPNLTDTGPGPRPTTGNYTLRNEFDEPLGHDWLFIRTPREEWWEVVGGKLGIKPRPDRIGASQQPSFTGMRVAHQNASISAQVSYVPVSPGDEAGLLALQNDNHYFAFGLTMSDVGEMVLQVRRRDGEGVHADGQVLAKRMLSSDEIAALVLKITIETSSVSFHYSLDGRTFETLIEKVDSSPLTTAVAGGFTGAVVGPYAQKDQE